MSENIEENSKLQQDRGTENLMSYADVERELGVKKGTLACWVHGGKIPFIRLGARTVRFRRSDLEAWLEKRSGGAK